MTVLQFYYSAAVEFTWTVFVSIEIQPIAVISGCPFRDYVDLQHLKSRMTRTSAAPERFLNEFVTNLAVARSTVISTVHIIISAGDFNYLFIQWVKSLLLLFY